MLKMPRAIHLQAVEPLPVSAQPSTPKAKKDPKDFVPYIVLTKDLVTHAAMTGGVLYTAKKIVDTSAQIAVIVAKARFK